MGGACGRKGLQSGMDQFQNKLTYEDAVDFVNSLSCAAILDAEARYTYVSPAWCEVTQLRPEDVLGKRVDAIFPDTYALETLNTGKTIYSHPVMTHAGRAFTNYFPRMDQSGKITGCFLHVIINGPDEERSIRAQLQKLSSQVDYYKKELIHERGAKYSLDNIIGESQAIKNLKEQILHAANSTSTVLIEGETGSGKELIAHSIHAMGPRSTGNFVRVNCSAIPGELMESEFFGYAAGAFTGASRKGKVGRFQIANKGSIFLDEVNLLPLTMQPKFLRALQEREIDPVGGTKSIPVDVRVIAATNIPLHKLVEEGKFRSDLYYRLNVIRIAAPPLRERIEDIPLLADNLIQRLNVELGTFVQGIDKDSLDLLMEYDWPGNVRELQNAIEAAIDASSGPILHKEDFFQFSQRVYGSDPKDVLYVSGQFDLRKQKRHFEKELIQNVLKITHQNKQRAAKMLGISRTVLYDKMEQYHLK